MSEEMLLARSGGSLTPPYRAPVRTHGYDSLIAVAAAPDDPVTLALAGIIAMAPRRRPPYDVPVGDLDDVALAELERCFFPGLAVPLASTNYPMPSEARLDEFGDLAALLMDHRTHIDESSRWLAHAIATACMAENHLWQDMGLPSRQVLSGLMRSHFTSLALLNSGDMKWKKFFYRQLCERAGLRICRAPSCAACDDYPLCFGPEEG